MSEEQEDFEDVKESSACWEEVEKEIVLIQALIKRLPNELKTGAAYRIAFEAVLWGGCCPYSSIGILEAVKMDLHESFHNCEEND